MHSDHTVISEEEDDHPLVQPVERKEPVKEKCDPATDRRSLAPAQRRKKLQYGKTQLPHWKKRCQGTRVTDLSMSRLWAEIHTVTNTVLTVSKGVSSDIPSLERKGTCESLSLFLWASLRSLTAMHSNVVKLPLNGKSLSWLLTCVAHQLSRVSCALGSRAVASLLCLSTRQRDTGFVFVPRS